MHIAKDCVVQFHYLLTDDEGRQLEDSRQGEPMAYLHGARNIFPLLEAAMQDRQAGDTFSVTLTPENAYGVRVEGAVRRISRKHIRSKTRLQPGMIINVETDQGQRQVVVVKVGKFVVDVDTNHPMAGLTLSFAVEIIDVRKASEEELRHGHAHGAGGHHH